MKAFGAPLAWDSTPFDDAARAAYGRLLQLAQDIASGRVSVDRVEPILMSILTTGHVDSHYAGQEMSGYVPSRVLAQRRGELVALGQNSFVRGLVTALDGLDPRYWDAEEGGWREDRLRARLGFYVGRTRGTAYDGWVSAAPGSMLYNWNLGAVEEHCDECPVLAGDSPYLGDGDTSQLRYPTLYTKPGECDTPCLFNCTCTLSRLTDGMEGPQPFKFRK